MAVVHDELIVARQGPPGSTYLYTYTLASRLGGMLRQLQDRFGPRDQSYTFLGIEFCGEVPRTWFPSQGNCKHIIIQLTHSAMSNLVRAVYQLAHEAVHLLDPVTFGNASVFEEGVATLYSLEYARTIQPSYTPSDRKYDAAASLANQALTSYPNAIKYLRSQGAQFSNFVPEQLIQTCPQLPPAVARTLCSSFQTWSGDSNLT
jgi:hypothetical protein